MQNTLLLVFQNGFIFIFCLIYALLSALKKYQNPPSYFAQICFLTLYLAPLMSLILQIFCVVYFGKFDQESNQKYIFILSLVSPILSAVLIRFNITADNPFKFKTKFL